MSEQRSGDFDGSAGSAFQDRVLVTGGGGFLGTHLVRRLVDHGAEVHATCRDGPGRVVGGVSWYVGDLRDFDFVLETLRSTRPRTVVHLAARVTGSRDIEAVLPTLAHTVVPAVNLLVAAVRTVRPRVVLVGSIEESGPAAEESFPRSPYAAAKGAVASYGRMFSELWGLPLVQVRPSIVYGPEQENLTRLIPYTIVSLLRNKPPRVHNGARRADWVYVDDVIEGLIAACTLPELEGETLELGTGVLATVGDVVATIDRLVGASVSPRVGEGPGRPFECERAARIDRAREFGWTAKVDLEEGLRRTVAWYRTRRESSREPPRSPGIPPTQDRPISPDSTP